MSGGSLDDFDNIELMPFEPIESSTRASSKASIKTTDNDDDSETEPSNKPFNTHIPFILYLFNQLLY